jgi:excisionase family DNA binding protein
MLTPTAAAHGLHAENDRLLKVAEIAGLLRVAKMTVYRRIDCGDLKAVKIGRMVRVREADLREFLEVPESENLADWITSSRNSAVKTRPADTCREPSPTG